MNFKIDFHRTNLPGIIVFPVALLLVIVLTNYLIPQANIVGLGSIIALGILALVVGPFQVFCWTLVFATLFAVTLLGNAEFMGRPDAIVKLGVRVATLIAGGCVAMIASRERQKLSLSHNILVEFISRLPLPILVSNRNGGIIFCSQRACEFLEKDKNEILGSSFFSHFGSPEQDRTAFQDYFDLLDQGAARGRYFDFLLNDPENHRAVTVWLTVLDFHGTRLAISVIYEKPDAVPGHESGELQQPRRPA